MTLIITGVQHTVCPTNLIFMSNLLLPYVVIHLTQCYTVAFDENDSKNCGLKRSINYDDDDKQPLMYPSKRMLGDMFEFKDGLTSENIVQSEVMEQYTIPPPPSETATTLPSSSVNTPLSTPETTSLSSSVDTAARPLINTTAVPPLTVGTPQVVPSVASLHWNSHEPGSETELKQPSYGRHALADNCPKPRPWKLCMATMDGSLTLPYAVADEFSLSPTNFLLHYQLSLLLQLHNMMETLRHSWPSHYILRTDEPMEHKAKMCPLNLCNNKDKMWKVWRKAQHFGDGIYFGCGMEHDVMSP